MHVPAHYVRFRRTSIEMGKSIGTAGGGIYLQQTFTINLTDCQAPSYWADLSLSVF
jgi:hypothetical protein